MDEEHSHYRTERPALLLVVLLLVFGFFFVQAIGYFGLIGRLAEWQFAGFERYFPALTMIVLLLIPALIIGLVAMPVRRRELRREGEDAHAERELLSCDRWIRVFDIAIAVAGVLALGTFVHFLELPDPSAPIVRSDLASGEPIVLKEGPMELSGTRRLGPVALFTNDLVFNGTTIYLAPVGVASVRAGPSGARVQRYNAFVEVDRQEAESRAIADRYVGILRREALPPEIVAMYRGAGYDVSADSAVLFRDAATMRRPVLVLMGEFLVFGLISLCFRIFLARSRRKLVQRIEDRRIKLLQPA